jgi:hypothetical protein
VFGGADGDTMLPDILRTTDGVTFTRVGTLPVPVRYPAIAVVGKAIYVFGGVSNPAQGIDTPAVQRFDTVRGVVDTVTPLPTALSHASALVLRGQVFLLGGYVENSRLSNQILRFDPATGAVTVAERLATGLTDAAAVVLDEVGYVVRGHAARPGVGRGRGRRRWSRLPRRRPGCGPHPARHRHRRDSRLSEERFAEGVTACCRCGRASSGPAAATR